MSKLTVEQVAEKMKLAVRVEAEGISFRVDYNDAHSCRVLSEDDESGEEYWMTYDELREAKFFKLTEF